MSVLSIVRYPNYTVTRGVPNNDISLLYLNATVSFSDYIKPVCLPRAPLNGREVCYTTGWGREETGNNPSILQQVRVRTFQHERCNIIDRRRNVQATRVCATVFTSYAPACYGDSGGPLVCLNKAGRWEVHGVTSYGPSGCRDSPGPVISVFTNMYFYRSWIQETIAQTPSTPSVESICTFEADGICGYQNVTSSRGITWCFVQTCSCGKRHPFVKEKCPAWGKVFSQCDKHNHFSSKCPNKGKQRQHKVHQVDTDEESSDGEEEYVLSVSSKGKQTDTNGKGFPKRIFARMILNRKTIVFQLDCGATVNILPENLYAEIYNDRQLKKVEKSTTTLVVFNGTETVPVVKRCISMKNPKNGRKYSVEFVIVKGDYRPLLGARAVQQMNLITVETENIMLLSHQHSDDVKSRKQPGVTMNEIKSSYRDVFQGEGKLEGLLHLEVDDKVQPDKLPCRKVPVALQPKLKEQLETLTKKGIIKPVTVPTDWISAMVVVSKPDGRLRLCIDPKPLNSALKRNHYPTPTIDDLLPDLANAKCFSHADAKNGFWQVELDEESSHQTTFETPWGRYRWLRMPFGISTAPEEFQRRINEALEGLDGVKVVHDDVLVFGVGDTDQEADEDHDRKVIAFMDRCREKNIKLNQSKFHLKCREVPYLGHILSSSGLKVDPSKVTAIKDMPAPTDKKSVKRLLGMVNFLQKFAPKLSSTTAPLRELLKNENHFLWDEEVHGKCLQEVKDILSSPPVLRYFEDKAETVLQCDASQDGLGACLMQNGQPVAYASRSFSSAEKNYAQIEREMLAIVFGMERFEQYVYGRKVRIESDHKPLESIVRKSLHSAQKRLQRMLLRLQKFDYEVTYKKGTQMYLADALSRAYLPYSKTATNEHGDVMLIDDRCPTAIETESINMVEYLAISDLRIELIQKATSSDPTMSTLKRVIQDGWPDRKEDAPFTVQQYFPFRDELSVQNGIVFKGERVIVPVSVRPEILHRLHSSHIGLQSCIRRARELVYWPNMIKDITDLLSKCDTCNALQNNQPKEALISHEIPSRPWEKVGCDLFEFDGKDYMILADYYSDYFEIDRLHDKTATTVIKTMKSQFDRHGIPVQLMSDNGPPYNSTEFKKFADKYEFEHITSSPRYPQSNGKVESAVKTVKQLMAKSLHAKTDPFLALLEWRNIPAEGIGSSSRFFHIFNSETVEHPEHWFKSSCFKELHDQTKEARFEKETFRDGMDILRSERHCIYRQRLNKVPLTPFDSKRWIDKNGVDTLAYGHKVALPEGLDR
ncbi:uncharacterized protein K02A2.6-like [Liolophura sinensis]|uniref:uncharacterized protein K02A2.6-like n=1 Tax=Liolophura sinensis TaxID=3198878 RepID=UPI0031595538